MLILDETGAALARRLEDRAAPGDNAVLACWRRAEALGVARDSRAFPEGTTGSELAVRRDRLADVFREEGALLAPIAEQLAARALVAIVADPDGVILATHGGGAFIDPAARVRLVCGARWSEDTRGTNAIGTVIAEGRPVAVVGSAHYEERNRGLFCYATPIRDAYNEVAAVLDVTGPIAAHDPAVGVAVQAAGAGLERALKARAYAHAGATMLRTIERFVLAAPGPAFVVDPDGALRVVNAAARAELGIAPDVAATCERVFGSRFDDLLRAAVAGERPWFETPAATYDVELDPIVAGGGRAIGVAVRLTARHRVFAPPPPRAAAAPRVAVPAPFASIVSADAEVDRAKAVAARLAVTDLPVLLLAETGTGKELFARAVHAASSRARGPFVPVNCGAFAESLLEAELFGHAPHAFTGAARGGADGKLAAADGGTLFLDEIAEMPDRLQTALLRVLEDGVYSRVGEARARRASFRLVCATCRDLPALVAEGSFRRDLFYRVHGAAVTIPPLRERSDVLLLARALVAELTGGADVAIAPDAEAWLRAHDWPGNVRELKNALAHALALKSGAAITRADLPRPLVASASPRAPTRREDILRGAFEEALAACGGNVTLAAQRLGVARSTLYRMRGRRPS